MAEQTLQSQAQTAENEPLEQELALDQAEESTLQTIQQNDEELEQELQLEEDTEEEVIIVKPTNEVSTTEFSWGKFIGSFSINLFLPFINGLMLGFGEIIAHEIGFKFNWIGAKVYRPALQQQQQQQKSKYL